jgi:hypothetical protein
MRKTSGTKWPNQAVGPPGSDPDANSIAELWYNAALAGTMKKSKKRNFSTHNAFETVFAEGAN